MFRANFATQKNKNTKVHENCIQAFGATKGSKIALRKALPSTKTTTVVRTTVLSESPNAQKLCQNHDIPVLEVLQARSGMVALMTESVVLCVVLWDCSGKTRHFKHVIKLYTVNPNPQKTRAQLAWHRLALHGFPCRSEVWL